LTESTRLALFVGVAVFASLFQAVTGFGFNLISSGILFLFFDPKEVILSLAIPSVLLPSALLIPFIFVGVWLGARLAVRLNDAESERVALGSMVLLLLMMVWDIYSS
jgi:uncharacterized membrane protein YfcA